MKNAIITFFLLVLSVSRAQANTCVANASGNWAAAGTWISCGGTFPGFGDAATIGAFTVTVAANTTAQVGTDGATGTAAITMSAGNLVINGTLDVRGDLVQQRGSTVTGNGGGLLILDSPNSSTQRLWQMNNMGSGSATMTIAGTAWTAGNFFTVNGDGGRGGTFAAIDFEDNGTVPTVNWAYSKMENLGSNSHVGYLYFGGTVNGVETESHVVWLTCGQVKLDLSTNGMNWNAVDFRNPTNSASAFQIGDGGAASVVRSMGNVTIYSTIANGVAAQIGARGMIKISNYVAYNVQTLHGVAYLNTIDDGWFIGWDTPIGTIVSANGRSGTTIQNSVFTSFVDNPHYVGDNNTDAGAGVGMTVKGNVFDSNNFTDVVGVGNAVSEFFELTENNNIIIDGGPTYGVIGTTTGKLTSFNNTSFQSNGMSIGETIGAATQAVEFENNLTVSQPDGIHQQSAFVKQSGFVMDYNGYFNMTGASNLTHPILGNRSYVGPETFQNNYWTSGTFGDSGKGLHDVTGNPNFVDSTRTILTYGGWATVQAAMREMVTINGIDYTGAPTTATGKSTAGAIQYIFAGFKPTNTIYHGTGANGADIGAVPFTDRSSTSPGTTIFPGATIQ